MQTFKWAGNDREGLEGREGMAGAAFLRRPVVSSRILHLLALLVITHQQEGGLLTP